VSQDVSLLPQKQWIHTEINIYAPSDVFRSIRDDEPGA
jgi:hypothetical protein